MKGMTHSTLQGKLNNLNCQVHRKGINHVTMHVQSINTKMNRPKEQIALQMLGHLTLLWVNGMHLELQLEKMNSD